MSMEVSKLRRRVLWLAMGLVVWVALYGLLASTAAWLTYGLLRLGKDGHLGRTVEFFLFETPKVLMLLTLVVFGVGIVRSFVTPERTRRILAGKRESAGNVLAALLGIVTPLLFLFGCAFVHRVCDHGRTAWRHVFFPDRLPHDQ